MIGSGAQERVRCDWVRMFRKKLGRLPSDHPVGITVQQARHEAGQICCLQIGSDPNLPVADSSDKAVEERGPLLIVSFQANLVS